MPTPWAASLGMLACLLSSFVNCCNGMARVTARPTRTRARAARAGGRERWLHKDEQPLISAKTYRCGVMRSRLQHGASYWRCSTGRPTASGLCSKPRSFLCLFRSFSGLRTRRSRSLRTSNVHNHIIYTGPTSMSTWPSNLYATRRSFRWWRTPALNRVFEGDARQQHRAPHNTDVRRQRCDQYHEDGQRQQIDLAGSLFG